MKKRLAALLCAAVLCVCLLPARAANVDEVVFTSVNDVLRPLSADTMPAEINGMLYVPASVFDNTVTGVNLGMYCNQSSTNNVVTLYSLRRMLVFDLGRGITYDQHSGDQLPARAVNRNGRIYLPVKTVCDFFELEDSYYYTKYGRLVRIKSSAAFMSDAAFIYEAGIPMENALQEFLRDQQPPETPSVKPDDEPVIEPEKPPAQVCLAFRCETGEGLEQILDLLERENCRGMFFVNADLLLQQDDRIRRVVGFGHGIGLLAAGESLSQSRLQLARANRTLARVARTAATAALVPNSQCMELEQDGWVCWQETVSGLPLDGESADACAQRVLQSIGEREGTVYVTLNDSRHTAQLLPALLRQLAGQEYVVALPLETIL